MADPPPHHCKDCGLVFDSGKSLDVHLHYHKENLLSKWAQQPSSDESNNNHVKKSRPTTTAADSSESAGLMSAPLDRYYHHSIGNSSSYVSSQQPPTPQEEPGYILGSGAGFPQLARTPTPNSCSSPSPHHQTVPTSSGYRFHPYQQYSHTPSPDHRNGMVSSSSPQQCEKCGFVCESGPALLEHLSVSHPPTPNSELFNRSDVQSIKSEPPDIFNQPEARIKSEPPDIFNQREVPLKSEAVGSQAEILDLDSHKVHVYQPPPPQEHSVSALLSWVNNVPEKDRFQPHNGSGIASPDCYNNVSTTTLTPPEPNEMLPHQQTTYQFDHISHLGTNNHQQISSTQIPLVVNQHNQQNKIMKAGNGTWKANDARRPKTYNCSACNKWFTSSGHLKRHYNTTLHKNAVKQSGGPDPATMPISSHHHPHKDPNYLSPHSPADSLDEQQPQQPQQQQQQQQTATQQQQQPQQQQQQPSHLMNHHHFLPSPPNFMAGPSEVTGGLLLHTAPYQEVTSPTPNPPPSTFLPFPPTHTYPHPQHPNFQPPHVSIDPQVTTSNISGNLNVLDIANYLLDAGKREFQTEQMPLPSFAQFQHAFAPNFSSFHPVVSSSDNNVGGLSPDQISSNYEALYHSTQSPLGDTYSLDNIQTYSIDSRSFSSPSGSSNESSSGEKSSFSSPVDFPSSTDQKIRVNRLQQSIKRSKKKIKVEDNSVSSTIEQSPPPSGIGSDTPPPQHKCLDCDKVFNKACYLTQHNKSFHSGIKPYKCERCGKRFPAEYLHQEHLSKHAGEKPYKCEICPKQFNHKTDLRRHMCLHTGDKPYACDVCGKGFIRKDHMLKHCETHKRRPSHTRFNKQNSALIESLKQHHNQQNNNNQQPHQQQFQSVVLPPPPTAAPPAHSLVQMVM